LLFAYTILRARSAPCSRCRTWSTRSRRRASTRQTAAKPAAAKW